MVNHIWRMPEKGRFVLCEEEMPKAHGDQVVVKMEYCGICGSDMHFFQNGAIGTRKAPENFVLGHECAGTVVEVGEDVRNLKVGDRVAMEPGIPCGQCEFCMTGNYNLCPDVHFMAAAMPPTDGALREYMAYPEKWCFKLPDHVSTLEGAMIEPLAVGMHAAVRGEVSMGKTVAIIGVGVITAWLVIKLGGVPATITAGLLTGGLTTTPGLSAAKEAAGAISEAAAAEVTAGYGIAYIFGVLGVVFFVQLVPKFLKVNMEEERKSFTAADTVKVKVVDKVLKKVDDLDFFPFLLTAVLGMILGAIKIPGINFSLGSSGGALIMGLIVGHFGHIGKIDLSVSKNTLNFFRELGLMLFLVGAGVPGGVNFMTYVKLSYFIYGAILTTVPMIVGYILGKYVFKLSVFNNLGSITGGMTSTPALGTLIHTAGTDAVTAAYAATYPMAMVLVVLAAKFIVMFF